MSFYNNLRKNPLPRILILSSYPERECGIATYTKDLHHAMTEKFGGSYTFDIAALEGDITGLHYPAEVKYIVNALDVDHFHRLADQINADQETKLLLVQHEFGLYGGDCGKFLIDLLEKVLKPVITTFHTVLPAPNLLQLKVVWQIAQMSAKVIVMTQNARLILITKYDIPADKIVVIPHGVHLIPAFDPKNAHKKLKLGDRLVLTTFGLISSGKSIDTALDALPAIIAKFPTVLYLIIGKTHPNVLKSEGEAYRNLLYEQIKRLNLENHVRFVNRYLSLNDLLTYLQRTDLYLFTSKDPNQAVSGTLAYAMSCGCPIVSTPIPHANEFLDGAGLSFDFEDSNQLAEAAIKILSNPTLMEQMSLNALQRISPTAWQNSAIAHVTLFHQLIRPTTKDLRYELPAISLTHVRHMTSTIGMFQFSKISNPDHFSGYTLDDNARAMIAVGKHFQLTKEAKDVPLLLTYLSFIEFCQHDDGRFSNYVDCNRKFFDKNGDENLEDANGRAIWALGELLQIGAALPDFFGERAAKAIQKAIPVIKTFHSPRAIAFSIKGLFHLNQAADDPKIKMIIRDLADSLVSRYRTVSDQLWLWFESYLTYANSVLPEALLYAYLCTGNLDYKNIAKQSFDYLLGVTFVDDEIRVISNKGWLLQGGEAHRYGEQPIDVAYTIIALRLFYATFKDEAYLDKMEIAFNWFLGKNHLQQIIYNPCTGGCYDGLEEHQVNLNQGAESTVSYLMARIIVEQYFGNFRNEFGEFPTRLVRVPFIFSNFMNAINESISIENILSEEGSGARSH